MTTNIDTQINARWIIPIEPTAETVLLNHSLLIQQWRIHDILPTNKAVHKYRPRTVVDKPDHALIPGLINAHTHSPMTLLRGIADDLPLMEWLNQHIWPIEKRWVDEAFVRDGTQLAVAEMLRGGITCFSDMYFFPEVSASVASDCGIRACIGMIVLDFPSAWANEADDYIAKGLKLHEKMHDHQRISLAFAPHAPYTVSDGPLEQISILANELNIPIHMHIHETDDEIKQSLDKYGVRPLARLERLGMLSPLLLAVHVTHIEDDEIALLANTKANVIHCPESNMKLASGFCPVHKMQQAGINVALGTDGAASNNDLNLIGEMRSAALLGKAVANDASALSASTALKMATLNGARALGLADRIGSLVVGKDADVVAINLGELETKPVYNPISQLVYAAGRHHVSDVWVQGQHVVKQKQLMTIDEVELRHKISRWGEALQE